MNFSGRNVWFYSAKFIRFGINIFIKLFTSNPKFCHLFQAVGETDSVYDSVNVIREWWKSETKDQVRILTVPDKSTSDFGINDADLIVHLAPPSSVQQFMRRFFCIKKTFMTWASTYTSLAKGVGADKVSLPKIPCRIAVTDEWKLMLPMIVQMASAAGEYSIIPPSILAASQRVLQSPQFLRVPPCLQQLYCGQYTMLDLKYSQVSLFA